MSDKVAEQASGTENQNFAWQVIENTLWIHYSGKTWAVPAVEISSSKKKTARPKLQQAGESTSPMPGKVINIAKTVGQNVIAGELVLVLEAMKMEYSILSPTTGSVAKMNVQLNEIVPLGHSLFEVKT